MNIANLLMPSFSNNYNDSITNIAAQASIGQNSITQKNPNFLELPCNQF